MISRDAFVKNLFRAELQHPGILLQVARAIPEPIFYLLITNLTLATCWNMATKTSIFKFILLVNIMKILHTSKTDQNQTTLIAAGVVSNFKASSGHSFTSSAFSPGLATSQSGTVILSVCLHVDGSSTAHRQDGPHVYYSIGTIWFPR